MENRGRERERKREREVSKELHYSTGKTRYEQLLECYPCTCACVRGTSESECVQHILLCIFYTTLKLAMNAVCKSAPLSIFNFQPLSLLHTHTHTQTCQQPHIQHPHKMRICVYTQISHSHTHTLTTLSSTGEKQASNVMHFSLP